MPPDHLADDKQSGSPERGSTVCGGELLDLPQHDYLDDGDV
jgi:hypothetical protein